MFRFLIRLLSVLGIVLALAGVGAYWWLERNLDHPLNLAGDGQVLRVEAGDTLSGVSRRLQERGWLENRLPLLVYAKLAERTEVRAGEYRIEPGQTPRQLLGKLNRGEVIRYRITFPEGLTLAQWLKLMAAHQKLDADIDLDRLRNDLGLAPDASLEGWFFPDTYVFTSADSGARILRQAHERMRRILADEWSTRQAGLPLETPYEALILASIVEKETGVPDERERIAGVFVRRLRRGMRLQTDPTVIYGLGSDFDGNLTRRHLADETPYNTYRIDGLPPTPIANPGREAIQAALHPAEGDALYFVARGDGSHYFSQTLKEHLQAVRRYQLKRGEDYRSSPAKGAGDG